MAFGSELKRLRENAKISVQKIADKIDVDADRWRKWEEKDLTPRIEDATKIENFFGMPLEDIMKLKSIKKFLIVPHENLELEDSGDNINYLQKRRDLKNTHNRKIPYYDAEASAGIAETDMSPIHAPAGTIDVGDLLSDSQAAIRIYGNSMLPNYPTGCVVGLAKVNARVIEPGEVYVIETTDRRLLKRLFYKNDDPESKSVLCYSDNVMKFEGGARDGKLAYPPFDIPKSEIKNLYVVTGVIKRNTNSVIINR